MSIYFLALSQYYEDAMNAIMFDGSIGYKLFIYFIYLTTIKHHYRLHQANISMKKL